MGIKRPKGLNCHNLKVWGDKVSHFKLLKQKCKSVDTSGGVKYIFPFFILFFIRDDVGCLSPLIFYFILLLVESMPITLFSVF